MQSVRAIEFKAFGNASVPELAEVPTSAVDRGTAALRVMAASINPRHVRSVADRYMPRADSSIHAITQTLIIGAEDLPGTSCCGRRNRGQP
jgi:NADPH:quinone reductase-like Zn-dependent oxidoreductase